MGIFLYSRGSPSAAVQDAPATRPRGLLPACRAIPKTRSPRAQQPRRGHLHGPGAIEREPISRNRGFFAGAEIAAEMQDALLFPDPARCDLLLTLAASLGWIAPDRGHWVLDNQRVGGWLRLTHWEQMSLLFSTWRDAVLWNDLRHVPGLFCEGGWTNNPALARERLLRLLRRLDAGSWYRVIDVIGLMKKVDPDFQRPMATTRAGISATKQLATTCLDSNHGTRFEGRLLRFLLEGPLFLARSCGLE